MKVLLMVLLLLPQLAAAKVYMCVDPATGNTVFTDKGCPKAAAREEMRVDPTNLDSGRNTAKKAPRKTWSSDRDTRLSGREYNARLRDTTSNSATASAIGADNAGS